MLCATSAVVVIAGWSDTFVVAEGLGAKSDQRPPRPGGSVGGQLAGVLSCLSDESLHILAGVEDPSATGKPKRSRAFADLSPAAERLQRNPQQVGHLFTEEEIRLHRC